MAKASKKAVKAVKAESEEPRIMSTGTGSVPSDFVESVESVESEERLVAEPQVLPGNTDAEDYLRKYQYRKQTAPGTIASDPPAGSKAEKMKKFLLSQPKVRMLIPRNQGEDRTVAQSVCLNGYRLDFPKDTYVEVPLQVADVLGESLNQTNAALMRDRIDGNKGREAALL